MNIFDFESVNTINWYCEYLGYEIEVILENQESEELQFFSTIVSNIDNWGAEFFNHLAPMLFEYYQKTMSMIGETQLKISSPQHVWDHAGISLLSIFCHDSLCYVTACGTCEWEDEHGLEIDVDEMNAVLYVGSYISNGFHEDPQNPSIGNYVLPTPSFAVV